MKITLRELKKYNFEGLDETIKIFGVGILDTEVTPIDILKYIGIKDAIWCLYAFKYRDYCLFLADVAESVLHIFEDEYPNDNRPRKAIEGIRLYHTGKVDKDELGIYATAAYAATADAATAAYATAVSTAGVALAAASSSYYAIAYGTSDASAYCAFDAASASVYYAADTTTAAREKKWKEIEELFIKHFE